MERNITAEEFQQALNEDRIYVVGSYYNPTKGWTRFRIYMLKNDLMFPVVVPEASLYYKKNTGEYRCTTIGTSRPLEIIVSIAYALGIPIDKINQSWTNLN